jgi:hypothetical protein
MLAAKELVPHGNADKNTGFKQWLGARFAALPYRTCASWMEFAAVFMSKAATLPPLKKRPLALTNGDITEQDRSSMLKAIPLVMDNKSMTKFMRDQRLLRDPQKQKHHPPKPVSNQEAAKAKAKQARRVWEGIASDLETATKIVSRVEDVADLKRYADALVDAGNKIREIIKKRAGGKT